MRDDTHPSKPPAARPGGSPIVDGLRATLPAVLMMAVLLLAPAAWLRGGAWLWPRGLAFVGVYGAIMLAGNLALSCFRPAHLSVRRQGVVAKPERKQPRIDAVGSAALIGFALAWLVFVPVDVFALRLLPAPAAAVSWVGGLCVVVGAALTPMAVWENRFAAPNVQDQAAQGQRVIDTGVYGRIRHPIYAGNLLLFGGAALWLGSYAAFAGLGVLLVATAGRILIEEAYLRANVRGYAEYAERVRSRLIPYIL
jgi:protein-S-isoprenylcysteine O-methyltransferase Ste14